MNEEYDYIINAFTKDGDNVNEEVDNLTVGCITSKNNSFGISNDGIVNAKGLSLADGSFIDSIYPIGSIYMSVNNINPSTLFGGTWEQIKDVFLLACGNTYNAGSIGGNATHSHTVNSHTHTSAAHTHGLSNGYALINPSATANGIYASVKTNVTSWKDNTKATTSGHASSSTANTRATALAGNTNSTTPGATGAASPGTSSASNLPPYLAVYVWKRVS